MAEAERQGVVLRLTQEEAEDLHGLLWSHVSGEAADNLISIHAALADQQVSATKFDAHHNEGNYRTIVLRNRIGSVEF